MNEYEKMTFLFVVFTLFCSFLIAVPGAEASTRSASHLEVIYRKSEPDPLRTGEYADVWVKIENTGSMEAEDVSLEFVPEFPFSLDPGKEAIREFEDLAFKRVAPELINMYHYIKMRLLPKATLTIDSIKMLDDTNKDCWFYKALLLLAPRNINDIKPHFTHISEESLLEKVYFQSLNYDDEDAYKRYLKDICLPLAIEKQEMDYIDFFSNKLITLSCDNARYKEALAIYTKKNKALNKLSIQL